MSNADSQLELGPNALLGVPGADDFDTMMRGLDLIALDEGDDPGELVDEQRAPEVTAQQASPPSRPVPVAPAPRPRSDGRVAFPLLDSELEPCLLAGPFHCVDVGDGELVPAIMVHETAQSQVVNAEGRGGRVFIGYLTHDASEDDLLKHFGPGRYSLAVKGEHGGFLKWGKVQVGRLPQQRRAGVIGRAAPVDGLGGLGGPPLAAESAPSPLMSLLERMDQRLQALETKKTAAVDDVVTQAVSNAEAAVKQIEALQGLGERLRNIGGRRDEPEDMEELGIIDGATEKLGEALAGAVKLKDTMRQFKMLMGSND